MGCTAVGPTIMDNQDYCQLDSWSQPECLYCTLALTDTSTPPKRSRSKTH